MPRYIEPNRAIHRTVRFLMEEVRQRGLSCRWLSDKCGFSNFTTVSWRKGATSPRVDNLEAALNAIGYKLVVTPMENKDDPQAL